MPILHKVVSEECSKITAMKYSTSFYSAIKMLHQDLRAPICNIYGFVRFADEIVDTFHEHDKETLLAEFKRDTYLAIERGISSNPILQSFQHTVKQYKINHAHIEAFFKSMEMDLQKVNYTKDAYENYIYGSAEVVGLMCLHVFCEGNDKLYAELEKGAQNLGAAFQKVNFLRDVKADVNNLDRTYFPNVDFNNFTAQNKKMIEDEIAIDFAASLQSIKKLPWKARFGVYVAYKYYLELFNKIKTCKPEQILDMRIRIPNYYKAYIVFRAGVKNKLRLIK